MFFERLYCGRGVKPVQCGCEMKDHDEWVEVPWKHILAQAEIELDSK